MRQFDLAKGRAAERTARQWVNMDSNEKEGTTFSQFCRDYNTKIKFSTTDIKLAYKYFHLISAHQALPAYLSAEPEQGDDNEEISPGNANTDLPTEKLARRVKTLPQTSKSTSKDLQFTVYLQGREERMTCPFCHWDKPYSIFSMEDHSRVCEQFLRTRSSDQTAPTRVVPVRAKTGTPITKHPTTRQRRTLRGKKLSSPTPSIDELSMPSQEPPRTPRVLGAVAPAVMRPPQPVAVSAPIQHSASLDETAGFGGRHAIPRSAREVGWQLLNDFDRIKTERFRRMQAEWMHSWGEYQEWLRRSEAEVAWFRQQGRSEDAELLLRTLLSKKFNYSDFEYTYSVGTGTESIRPSGLSGFDAQSDQTRAALLLGPSSGPSSLEPSENQDRVQRDSSFNSNDGLVPCDTHEAITTRARPGGLGWRGASCLICRTKGHEAVLLLCVGCDSACHSCCMDLEDIPEEDWTCPECTRVPSPGAEVSPVHEDGRTDPCTPEWPPHDGDGSAPTAASISGRDSTLFSRDPISVSEARQGMYWISITEAGQAFCLRCNCEKTVLRTPGSCVGTHGLMKAFFRRDPFRNDRAVIHFRDQHGLDHSPERLVKEYGVPLLPNVSPKEAAAHNDLISQLYQGPAVGWTKALKHGVQRKADPDRVSRSITAESLGSSAHAFPWPAKRSRDHWVLLCPFPGCPVGDFTPDSVLDEKARSAAAVHFWTHGLKLRTGTQALALFGYRGMLGDLLVLPETEPELTIPWSSLTGESDPLSQVTALQGCESTRGPNGLGNGRRPVQLQ